VFSEGRAANGKSSRIGRAPQRIWAVSSTFACATAALGREDTQINGLKEENWSERQRHGGQRGGESKSSRRPEGGSGIETEGLDAGWDIGADKSGEARGSVREGGGIRLVHIAV